MTTEQVAFDFYGDEYNVEYNGSVWVAPCNGSQHATIGQAIRAELKTTIEASGDDVEDFEAEILKAIDQAWSKCQ